MRAWWARGSSGMLIVVSCLSAPALLAPIVPVRQLRVELTFCLPPVRASRVCLSSAREADPRDSE